MAALRPSELQCQRTIVAAARLGGWLVHAERAAQRQSGRWATPIQGDKGFVDLILVRGERVMAIELKRKPNRVEATQLRWLDALTLAGVDTRVVWVPEGLDEFCQELVSQ